jgi:hypothetical protein
MLGPAQLLDVPVEFVGALLEVGEVLVGQHDPLCPGDALRHVNVVLRDLVADTA